MSSRARKETDAVFDEGFYRVSVEDVIAKLGDNKGVNTLSDWKNVATIVRVGIGTKKGGRGEPKEVVDGTDFLDFMEAFSPIALASVKSPKKGYTLAEIALILRSSWYKGDLSASALRRLVTDNRGVGYVRRSGSDRAAFVIAWFGKLPKEEESADMRPIAVQIKRKGDMLDGLMGEKRRIITEVYHEGRTHKMYGTPEDAEARKRSTERAEDARAKKWARWAEEAKETKPGEVDLRTSQEKRERRMRERAGNPRHRETPITWHLPAREKLRALWPKHGVH